jgi:hypothetical protein
MEKRSMIEIIKTYRGQDPALKDALLKIEDFIGYVENAVLADDSTIDASDAVTALNTLIERLNDEALPATLEHFDDEGSRARERLKANGEEK